MKLGLATNCSIRTDSQFARKNYFYPDLPKAYQISQYERPICDHGHLEISTDEGQKQIGITRIHLEEDAGKLLHQENSDSSSVDLNRAGIPLVEIVSEPELSSSEEAKSYMEKMHAILTALGICSGDPSVLSNKPLIMKSNVTGKRFWMAVNWSRKPGFGTQNEN